MINGVGTMKAICAACNKSVVYSILTSLHYFCNTWLNTSQTLSLTLLKIGCQSLDNEWTSLKIGSCRISIKLGNILLYYIDGIIYRDNDTMSYLCVFEEEHNTYRSLVEDKRL